MGLTATLVVVFAVVAVGDWWVADQTPDARTARTGTKLTATGLLLAIAATAGEMDGAERGWLVAAVAVCLVGDALLLGDSEMRFLGGLGAFAAGHVAYVVTALLVGVTSPRLLIAVPFLVALLGYRFVGSVVPGARAAGGSVMAGAVAFYAVVISAMVTTATGTAHWAAAAGAMTFAVSDWMIGYSRFVRPFAHHQAAIMATYHAGQLLLITGLIAAG